MNTIFITGIGTGVGKTVIAAIVAEALEAAYWKPVQAGYDEGTDAEFVRSIISNKNNVVHPETYRLKLAASPHIAARAEGIKIDLEKIYTDYQRIIDQDSAIKCETSNVKREPSKLVIEGAGGLMVPLNQNEFVIDLIQRLNARVILVSRNYLGSINHSLLTANFCRQRKLDVMGWIFNDQYMNYEEEVVAWSGYAKIASVPFTKTIDNTFVCQQASIIKPILASLL